MAKPKPAACTVVSEPLRSKGFLSPFAARRAEGEKANGVTLVEKVATGEFSDDIKTPGKRRISFRGFVMSPGLPKESRQADR